MTKSIVTLTALVGRINRRLAHDDERLCKSRGFRQRQELGDFYVIDFNRNRIIACHVDPEEFGRESGVLHAHEVLIDPDSEN